MAGVGQGMAVSLSCWKLDSAAVLIEAAVGSDVTGLLRATPVASSAPLKGLLHKGHCAVATMIIHSLPICFWRVRPACLRINGKVR